MALTSRKISIGALVTVFMVALFTACSTVPVPNAEETRTTSKPAFTLRVLLQPEDTPALLEGRFGGEVLVWHGLADVAPVGSDEPTEPFALLAVDSLMFTASEGGGLAECSDLPGVPATVCFESNRANLKAGASISQLSERNIIAAGGAQTWGGGRSTIWNGGDFEWLPQNTGLWESLGLQMAQSRTMAYNLGAGVTVAVIDSGIDLTHPYLDTHVADPALWLDLVDGDRLPQDEGSYSGDSTPAYGHGTSVAGIIRQVAPEALILPIRVLQPDGLGYVSDVVMAIEHALESGADIINLSLGGTGRSEALASVIGRAAERGVYVVMSAGNTAGDVTFPASQSRDPLVPGRRYRLSVTSVDAADDRSAFAASGSSVGLAAPGESVWGPAPEALVAAWSGTSMAAPMASGALALALGEDKERLKVADTELGLTLERLGDELYAERNLDYLEHSRLGFSRLHLWKFLDGVLD